MIREGMNQMHLSAQQSIFPRVVLSLLRCLRFEVINSLIKSFLLLIPLMFATAVETAETAPLNFARSSYKNCPPLPEAVGRTVRVNNVNQLKSALVNASPNSTITLSDGIYKLNGSCLVINVPGLVLRSFSGNRDAVVLDGEYKTNEIIQITASNVIVADLTITRAYNHPIHVMSARNSNTMDTLIYNLHILDPGEQAIKINPVNQGYYTDNGVVACSHIELTDAGRTKIRNNCYTGGIDAHRSSGWIVRDNVIEGFWCQKGISEHAVHFWNSSSETIVERNYLGENARGVGFGMATSGIKRMPGTVTCSKESEHVDHFGGVIRNNFIYANSKALFNSEAGFDSGISLWQAFRPKVLHNTVYSGNPLRTFSSIEWRFPITNAEVVNNLVNVKMLERDGAKAEKSGNIDNAKSIWFVDAEKGDLHLSQTAKSNLNRGKSTKDVTDDIDGDPRGSIGLLDVGADESGKSPR